MDNTGLVREQLEHEIAALTASRDRFRDLVESTSDWLWEMDLDGKYTYVSPRARDMLGRQPDDLIGTAPFDMMPPAEAERMASVFQHFVSREEPFERIENVCLHSDGREIVMETSGVPVHGPNGDLQGYRGVDRDITERKQAEDAIRGERGLAKTYLDLAGVMFIALDSAGTVTLVNPKACEVLGYTEEQIVGMNWFDTCLPQRILEPVKQVFEQLVKGDIEPAEHHENPVLTKSGSERLIAWHNTVLRDDKGAIAGLLSSGEDITEHKHAEEALRKSEATSRGILEALPDLMFRVSRNGTYLDFHAPKDDDLYVAPKNIVGRTADELLPEDVARMFMEYRPRTLDNQTTEVFEYVLEFAPGDRRSFEARMTPFDSDSVLTIVRNTTEHKQAENERDRLEEQLRQAQKMEAVGQLAGGIAHDFNNILTVIQGNAELLKMDLPPDSEQATFANEVIKGAARAADLTRQLLAFARKGKWLSTPVDIHDIVTQTVSMLTHSIDRRIEIRLELNASPSTVMGDPTQLQNAMLNLGVNARDAMDDGGTLTYATGNVTLTRTDCDEHPDELTPGDFLEIRVTDTGAGMDEQTQKRIFEPFFTTKEVGKGTGLGLAGVYGCIRNHNGSVRVSSEPEQGAVFVILLPLGDTGPEATDQTIANSTPIKGTGRILIVDDEESVLDFVRTSLQNLGYTVSTCADGAVGVDYYRENHREIDLVIMDLIMPRMSGQDAFGEMKKIDPNVKVLISSGFSQTQASSQMLNDGALGLLSKPFKIAELSEAIAQHIRHR